MLKKIAHALIAICFIAFAGVQFNDPDPLVWILIYSCVALLAILEMFNFSNKYFTRIVYLTIFLYWICYTPDFIEWAKGGFISITGSMEASTPLIEKIREFGGLTIALLVVLYYFLQSFEFPSWKKKRK